jgi:L-threonylcarbamoyladenylate synthase
LARTLGKIELSAVAVTDKLLPFEKARSPGVMHKHYAPRAEMILVEGKVDDIMKRVEERVNFYKRERRKVGVLATDETANKYTADVVKSLGSRSDLASIAKNLFRLLREFDVEDVDVIIAEGVSSEGLGLAVMNRLRKAAGYKIVKG